MNVNINTYCRYLRKCIIASIVIALLLAIAITIVLVLLLTKPKASTISKLYGPVKDESVLEKKNYYYR